jgi:hypothetical protein
MTLEEFEVMVNRHDLTYEYSDDGQVWRRGVNSVRAIREVAKQFPIEDVKRIWNAAVDSKLIEGHREAFYWRE